MKLFILIVPEETEVPLCLGHRTDMACHNLSDLTPGQLDSLYQLIGSLDHEEPVEWNKKVSQFWEECL